MSHVRPCPIYTYPIFSAMHLALVAAIYSVWHYWKIIQELSWNLKNGSILKKPAAIMCDVFDGQMGFSVPNVDAKEHANEKNKT